MLSDPRGLPLTAASAEAVARLEATILAFCGLKEDVGDRLKETLAADPQLVMAHLLRGYFLLLLGKREFIPRAHQAAAAAENAIAASGATPREALHRQALDAWIARDTTRAIAILSRILADFPRDIVALKLVQFLLFYSGDCAQMHATVAAALPAWDESVPAYGFALGCHAFGLEESGDHDAAERTGRRAVALNPEDIWGAHAVAHVFEMQDRVGEGLAWIDALAPHWRTANNFAFHVQWHRCLYLLALRRFDEVLERYDREVRPDSTDDYLDVTNAISLLWRLEQRGVAVGSRWNELADRAAQRRDDHISVFADAHYAIALAASDPDAAAGWSQSAEAYARQSHETQAAVMDGVGLALGAAAIAHRHGDFAAALDRLLPLRGAIHRIGGSHAQRDVFAELVIDAAVKAGRHDVARDLLRERLAARPRNAWADYELGLLARCLGGGRT